MKTLGVPYNHNPQDDLDRPLPKELIQKKVDALCRLMNQQDSQSTQEKNATTSSAPPSSRRFDEALARIVQANPGLSYEKAEEEAVSLGF